MLEDLLPQDYSLIFKDSAVIFDDVPYYVLSFDGYMAECLNIGSQDYVYVDFREIKSVKIPNTGYYNHRGVCLYLMRMPCRRYKHGLSRENITCLVPEGYEVDDLSRSKMKNAHDLVSSLQSKSHYNLYMNIYPTLEETIALLQDNAYIIAFDRQFAVDRELSVYYKNGKVGNITKAGGVSFFKKYQHLKAALPKELK